jgi:hypothetical protein
MYACVSYESHKNRRLLPYIALNDWFKTCPQIAKGEFDISVFIGALSRKFKFDQSSIKIAGALVYMKMVVHL